VSYATGDLLVEDSDGAVAAAATSGALNGGCVGDDALMFAIASEGGGPRVEDLVDTDISLVIINSASRQRGVVVGQSRGGRCRQGCKNTLRKRRCIRERNDSVGEGLSRERIYEGYRATDLLDTCINACSWIFGAEEGVAAVGFGQGTGAVLV
jgi:hypothetical protein